MIWRLLIFTAYFFTVLIFVVAYVSAAPMPQHASRKPAAVRVVGVVGNYHTADSKKVRMPALLPARPSEIGQAFFADVQGLDRIGYEWPSYERWHLPERQLHVGIQAGHWQHELAPRELSPLWRNTGAMAGETSEQQTVLVIAEEVAQLLAEEGIQVDLLPATVPVHYQADAFVAIHADGNRSSRASGFKVAASGHDASGRAGYLAAALDGSYAQIGLRRDWHITKGMTGYYAFNSRLYDHSIDPHTPAALVETGFITNPRDRDIIVHQPEIAANGIARGILTFLEGS